MTFAEFLQKEPESIKRSLGDIFAGFSGTTPVHEERLATGDVLMEQGAARRDIFFLLSGQVALLTQYISVSTYVSYVLDETSAFSFLGDLEAMADFPHIISTVQAKTNCRLLRISEADYLQWLKSDIDVMARQTRSAIFALLDQSAADRSTLFLKSNERLAMFLMEYYKNNEPPDGMLSVRLSRANLAEAVGFSLRTVNRCVQKLHQEGYIGLTRGKITITEAQYRAMNTLL